MTHVRFKWRRVEQRTTIKHPSIMNMKLRPAISDILKKSLQEDISRQEALTLLHLDLHSLETATLMHTADRLSRETFKGKGENHVHIGINLEPCPLNCAFCSLTQQAGIFTEKFEFTVEQIISWAKTAEAANADALNIMTTGTYSFKRLLEIGNLLHTAVQTPLVANTRDISHEEGVQLLEAGFIGAYHAVRLGEGTDTPLQREKRIETIKVFRDVGLQWMNCVEPVGPEHTVEELVELMFLAKEYGATYSGVMRRVNFPGSPMERYGMITELQMAKLVAVSRLVMGRAPRAHCTHEPNTHSLMAGANLFFPELGASPRDNQPDTAKGRALDIKGCRKIFQETDWDPDRPSNCFSAS